MIQILFRDTSFVVVVKPHGVAVQSADPAMETLPSLLRNELKLPVDAFLEPVNRLDTPAGGVVLFALDPVATADLSRRFADRTVEKIYWVLTEAPLAQDQGSLVHGLVHDEKKNLSKAYRWPKDGAQKAELEYERKGKTDRFFWYQVKLLTGRTHQIRAQFQAAGASIRGDLKYGAKRSIPGGGIGLWAFSLGFDSQIFSVPPPFDHAVWRPLASVASPGFS